MSRELRGRGTRLIPDPAPSSDLFWVPQEMARERVWLQTSLGHLPAKGSFGCVLTNLLSPSPELPVPKEQGSLLGCLPPVVVQGGARPGRGGGRPGLLGSVAGSAAGTWGTSRASGAPSVKWGDDTFLQQEDMGLGGDIPEYSWRDQSNAQG